MWSKSKVTALYRSLCEPLESLSLAYLYLERGGGGGVVGYIRNGMSVEYAGGLAHWGA